MALREINLVPWDLMKKNTLSRHLWFWAKGLLLVVLVLGAVYLVTFFWMNNQKQTLPQFGQVKEQMAVKTNAVKDLQGRLQEIQAKILSLSTLTRGQLFFEIIQIFSNCLNDQTWINTLSLQRTPEDILVLVCEGEAWTHHALGMLIHQLSLAPRIQEVVLENAFQPDAPASPSPDPQASGDPGGSVETDSLNRAAELPGTVQFKIFAKIVGLP